MAESEARDWVLIWVEDLHRRAGSKRFWEKEQERIDLGTCLQFYPNFALFSTMGE